MFVEDSHKQRISAPMHPPPRGMDEQQSLGQFHGVIKSFDPGEKGYDLFYCPDLKQQGFNDVLLHREQNGAFDVESEIMFIAFLNPKGQPQAKELMPPEVARKQTKKKKNKKKRQCF